MSNSRIWYGFESSIDSTFYTSFVRKPNGSNKYLLRDASLKEQLPQSHVPLTLNSFPRDFEREIKFGSASSITLINRKLVKTVNRLLFPINPDVKIVDTFVTQNIANTSEDRKSEQTLYTAIYSDASFVTLPRQTLLQLQKDLLALSPSSFLEKQLDSSTERPVCMPSASSSFPDYATASVASIYTLPAALSQLDPLNLSLDMPFITELRVDPENADLTEYNLRVGFLKLARQEASIIPYLSYLVRFTLPDQKILFRIPYWEDDDAAIVLDFETEELPEVFTATPVDPSNYLQLSNTFWYPIPLNMRGNVNLAEFRLDDAEHRLQLEFDEAGLSISVVPNGIILATFSEYFGRAHFERIKERYFEEWNSGSFLTNWARRQYSDSFFMLPSNGIVPRNIFVQEDGL